MVTVRSAGRLKEEVGSAVLGGQPGHRVEDLVQTAAAVLGLVHREVGVSQQGLRDVLAGAGKGDADAGDPDPVVGEGEWRGHHCDDALGHGPVSYTHLTLPTIYSV